MVNYSSSSLYREFLIWNSVSELIRAPQKCWNIFKPRHIVTGVAICSTPILIILDTKKINQKAKPKRSNIEWLGKSHWCCDGKFYVLTYNQCWFRCSRYYNYWISSWSSYCRCFYVDLFINFADRFDHLSNYSSHAIKIM